MAKNNYWMKLWFDVLRDPKMGMLPDRLWRRVIELFLIAGQHGEDGLLPDVATIAWQLNKSASAIVSDLEKIVETGIICEVETGKWTVTNFAKRNEPVDLAKRVKDFRHRERYEKGNENETETKRECNDAVTTRYQEEEEQKNRRTELKDPPPQETQLENQNNVYAIYESEIGTLTATIADGIKAAQEDYPDFWIIGALKECSANNKRSWKYALAILRRWKVDGFQVDTRTKHGNNGRKPAKQAATIDDFRKLYDDQKASEK